MIFIISIGQKGFKKIYFITQIVIIRTQYFNHKLLNHSMEIHFFKTKISITMKNICFYHQTKIETKNFYHKPNHNKNITFFVTHSKRPQNLNVFIILK